MTGAEEHELEVKFFHLLEAAVRGIFEMTPLEIVGTCVAVPVLGLGLIVHILLDLFLSHPFVTFVLVVDWWFRELGLLREFGSPIEKDREIK